MSALKTVRPPFRAAGLALIVLVVFVLLLVASAPASPDDWDGLGFLSSVVRFDIRSFSPHPPGYPVYVAALRAANLVASDALTAAYVVSISSAVACAALAFTTARSLCRRDDASLVAVFAVATPLAWRAMSAVGSEALALAFVALGVWSLVAARRGARGARGAPYVVGAAVGLGLGVRLSWAPLFIPMLVIAPGHQRVRTALSAAVAAAMWAVPLIAMVGPSELIELYRVHATGHASRWGGTAITEPGLGRVLYFARDVFVDGLGIDADALGILIGAGALALAVAGVVRWRRARWRGARAVALLVVPYACWIAIGQNLRQQPRHALPIVVAIAVGLAVAATESARWRSVGLVLAALVLSRTATDAAARRTILPPGAQLAAFANGLPDARGTAVFAGPSARFFETTPLADRALSTPSLDDARLALTRLDAYPRHILVTSELEGLDEAHLPVVATFCRPPRLDRRAPCLVVYEWSLTP
jgi:hypothetical protein